MKRAKLYGEFARAKADGSNGKLELFRAMLRVLEHDQNASRRSVKTAELDFGPDERAQVIESGPDEVVSKRPAVVPGDVENRFFDSCVELTPAGSKDVLWAPDLLKRYREFCENEGSKAGKDSIALGRCIKKWLRERLAMDVERGGRGCDAAAIHEFFEGYLGRESKNGRIRHTYYKGVRLLVEDEV